MRYYVYFSDEDGPKTGLTPSWEYLLTGTNSTNKTSAGNTSATISELGGGWYVFDITFGSSPWDVTTEDLVGVIDGGSSLSDVDRYKPVAITKRGLGLAFLGHDNSQDVSDSGDGDVTIYDVDGSTAEFVSSVSYSGQCNDCEYCGSNVMESKWRQDYARRGRTNNAL